MVTFAVCWDRGLSWGQVSLCVLYVTVLCECVTVCVTVIVWLCVFVAFTRSGRWWLNKGTEELRWEETSMLKWLSSISCSFLVEFLVGIRRWMLGQVQLRGDISRREWSEWEVVPCCSGNVCYFLLGSAVQERRSIDNCQCFKGKRMDSTHTRARAHTRRHTRARAYHSLCFCSCFHELLPLLV